MTEIYCPTLLAIRNASWPVIAAVDSMAAGLGCDLALACDLRLASERATFAELFIRLGLIADGGFNVYPREVEEVMMTHPAVSMVAVIGVPHEGLGEEVKAVVVRKPNAEVSESELLDWCKETMAAYKYPRTIEFRDQLPMSATGKILKRELRVAG